MVRITALMDNKLSEHRALIAEHGLSLYVEYNGRRILFDCGAGSSPMHNAYRLGIDLKDLDAVVLSHSHYDHAAGFRPLVDAGMGSRVLYTGPGFFQPKFARSGARYTDLSAGFGPELLQAHGIRHQVVTGLEEIFPGVWLISGFPRIHTFEQIPARFVRRTDQGFREDDFGDEVCMALQTDQGLAVLVGCSHPGILNMMTQVRTLLGQPIRAVYGGTHLVEADERRIDTTIETLHRMGLEVLGLSHCSGDAAEQSLENHREVTGCHLGVGDTIFYDEPYQNSDTREDAHAFG